MKLLKLTQEQYANALLTTHVNLIQRFATPKIKLMQGVIGLCLISLFTPLTNAAAQMTVSPLNVTLDQSNTRQTIHLTNPSDRVIEIRTSWLDLAALENGSYRKATLKERKAFSAAPYLKVHPARVTLTPGEKTTIEVWHREDRSVDVPERRSHLYFQATPLLQPLRKVSSALPIDMSVAISIPVVVRSAAAAKSAEISDVELTRTPDGQLAISANLMTHAATSLRGNIDVQFTDSLGKQTTLATAQNIAIYPEVDQRHVEIDLKKTALPKGELLISFNNEASDTLASRLFSIEAAD